MCRGEVCKRSEEYTDMLVRRVHDLFSIAICSSKTNHISMANVDHEIACSKVILNDDDTERRMDLASVRSNSD